MKNYTNITILDNWLYRCRSKVLTEDGEDIDSDFEDIDPEDFDDKLWPSIQSVDRETKINPDWYATRVRWSKEELKCMPYYGVYVKWLLAIELEKKLISAKSRVRFVFLRFDKGQFNTRAISPTERTKTFWSNDIYFSDK